MSRTSGFKALIGDIIHNPKLDLLILDREKRTTATGTRKWYKILCLDCKRESWKEESSLLTKQKGCPYCNNSGIKEIGFNDIPTKAPWMIPYFPGGEEEARLYTPTQTKKVQFKCPHCGRLAKGLKTLNSLYYTHSIGCPCCKHKSMPEAIMYNILESNNIDFLTEVSSTTFPWLGNYRYDFYLPQYKCIIEVHGGLHYRNGTFTTTTLQDQLNRDKLKRLLANDHGIINYYEIDGSHCWAINTMITSCKDLGLFKFLLIDETLLNFELLKDRTSDEDLFNLFKELMNDITKTKKEIMEELNITAYKYQCLYARMDKPIRRKKGGSL